MDSIKVFSPGSVTNLSCGYDILGFCLDKVGDTITVTKTPEKGVKISSIDKYNLPTNINQNVAGIAAQAMMKDINLDYGFDIKIKKGIKPGSGIGSSAASSAGVVFAINKLIDSPFSDTELIRFAMEGEKFVSGSYHADNVSPILLGGFTLVRSVKDLDIIKLPNPRRYTFSPFSNESLISCMNFSIVTWTSVLSIPNWSDILLTMSALVIF